MSASNTPGRWPEFAAAAGLDAPTTAAVNHDKVTLAPS